jgi:hypothetical protein
LHTEYLVYRRFSAHPLFPNFFSLSAEYPGGAGRPIIVNIVVPPPLLFLLVILITTPHNMWTAEAGNVAIWLEIFAA